jgi:hypothetical protein
MQGLLSEPAPEHKRELPPPQQQQQLAPESEPELE